ncbi:MAG: hypothetical protein L3J41_07305 [Melioribacteraceae bacterium]|nr:hypothetical protein [Melioribacteraceae bacterium]
MKTIAITIVEKINSEKFMLNCARCDRTGRGYNHHGNRSTEPCKVCNGRGVILVEIDGEIPFVNCARCEGTGRGYNHHGNRSKEPCWVCKGVGAQPITGDMIILD